MSISGLIYFLGMSQFLLLFGMIMFGDNVKVQTFLYTPRTVNGSLSHDPGDIKTASISLALPLLLASLLAAVFVSNTFSLSESGILQPDQTYSSEIIAETGLWDTIFWVFVFLVHLCCVLTLNTPVDLYAAVGALFLQIEYLTKLCRPVEPDKSRNFMQSNLHILGLVAGLAISVYNIPPDGNNRYSIFFILFLFDYFLCIGHTWDACPKMITVCNCRLCYACTAPLCLAALYGVWVDRLLFSPLSENYRD